jgi:HTH-type transcriptional regulator, competence development regulator
MIIFGLKLSKMKFEKSFGDMVKKLREERKLPLREVAEALNIDTSMLGKIEKNNRKPTKLLIDKFAKFYNVSNKDLTIAFLSDSVVYQIMIEEDFAAEVLKVAEKKVQYLKYVKPLDQ